MAPQFHQSLSISKCSGASAAERSAYRHATNRDGPDGNTQNYVSKAAELWRSETTLLGDTPTWAVRAFGEAAFHGAREEVQADATQGRIAVAGNGFKGPTEVSGVERNVLTGASPPRWTPQDKWPRSGSPGASGATLSVSTKRGTKAIFPKVAYSPARLASRCRSVSDLSRFIGVPHGREVLADAATAGHRRGWRPARRGNTDSGQIERKEAMT